MWAELNNISMDFLLPEQIGDFLGWEGIGNRQLLCFFKA
jgi:hypothetical protein